MSKLIGQIDIEISIPGQGHFTHCLDIYGSEIFYAEENRGGYEIESIKLGDRDVTDALSKGIDLIQNYVDENC